MADKSLRKFEHYKFHEEQQRLFVQTQENCQRNSAVSAISSAALNYHPSTLGGNHHHLHSNLLEGSPPIEQLLKMKAAAAAAVAAAASSSSSSAGGSSRQVGSGSKSNDKSSMKRSSPTLQIFPTGTTLTSVDGLPVLKRKRGRPPKNRVSEV